MPPSPIDQSQDANQAARRAIEIANQAAQTARENASQARDVARETANRAAREDIRRPRDLPLPRPRLSSRRGRRPRLERGARRSPPPPRRPSTTPPTPP